MGYALSGGGARGYAHVGILKVLEENGIYPDYITGTSIGSVVGAFYSSGYTASELEQMLLQLNIPRLLDDRFEREDLYIGQKRWPEWGNLNMDLDSGWNPRLPPSIFVGNRLNLELALLALPASPYQDFRQLPIPFAAVATNLATGDPVVFDGGSLMQAVRASIAVPSVMRHFEFEGTAYIDGGVSQNLPIAQVRQLGADVVIGLKSNSRLRSQDELVDALEILDQTINIGMTRNINANLDECDLLLEPDLSQWLNTDFSEAAGLIAAGEAYARKHLPEILALRDSLLARGHIFHPPEKIPIPDRYRINAIEVRGNEFVSSAKIKEYAGLESGKQYTSQQLIDACLEVWNSRYFLTVYPVLVPYDGAYRLLIYVQESERRHLLLNLSFTSEEKLNVAAILALDNLALKNSNLKAGLTLGGRNEINLDYVKNFGDFRGVYFRLFPYLSENWFYIYNEDNYRVAKIKSLEFGITPGVGLFANKLAVAETFFYSYRKKLYRDVSSTAPVDSLYLISGLGLKLYHESLNDDVFPTSGIRAFAKFNFARWDKISDQIYNKFVADLDVYSQLFDRLSLHLGLDYGTYFGAEEQGASDPFYFSGSHGYRGYQRYEVSSPLYKIYTLALVLKPFSNTFLETGVQGLNTAASDSWGADQDVLWSVYADLGYRTPIGPLSLVAAIRRNSKPNFYLNIGYDTDFFWFSRK